MTQLSLAFVKDPVKHMEHALFETAVLGQNSFISK
jgi:hypothetical protein